MHVESKTMDFPENKTFRIEYDSASGMEQFRFFDGTYNSLRELNQSVAGKYPGRCFIRAGGQGFELRYEENLRKEKPIATVTLL